MREIQDLMDLFPYCLLVALPVFIALSPHPVHAVSSAHDFPVHRLAQYEVGGFAVGSKLAAVSMDARSAKADPSNLLRKVVVTKLKDVTVAEFNELLSNGAGAFLFLLSPPEAKEEVSSSFLRMEEHLLSTAIEVPVYFATETPELLELVEALEQDTSVEPDRRVSAAQTLFNAIASTGYQLVSATSAVPKQQPDPVMKTLEGTLRAKGEDDSHPTVVVVAHYDTLGAAPTMSNGVDSNGSGVIALLELARLFSKFYKSSKTQPSTNLVFLLSSGGKMNFFGSKKWLEEHLDASSASELLSDVKFALCLDTIGNVEDGSALNMHVSKPPKEDTHMSNFHTILKDLAAKFAQSNASRPVRSVEMVHKKINLADERLAWEHERFSIRRLAAFTLSTATRFESKSRLATVTDRSLNADVMSDNIRLVAEALACVVYDYKESACNGKMFANTRDSVGSHLRSWTRYLQTTPRFAGLLTTDKVRNEPQNKVVASLFEALKTYTHTIKVANQKRDKRDPEFNFFDVPKTTMSVHKVKPAVFDLVLSLAIAGYLFVVYGLVVKSGIIMTKVARFIGSSSSPPKSNMNGDHHKTNGNHSPLKYD